MRVAIAISAAVLTTLPAFADAPHSTSTLSAPGGRFAFGQISDFRRDQYLLDTQTGRLWQIVCVEKQGDDCAQHVLEEIPFLGGGGPSDKAKPWTPPKVSAPSPTATPSGSWLSPKEKALADALDALSTALTPSERPVFDGLNKAELQALLSLTTELNVDFVTTFRSKKIAARWYELMPDDEKAAVKELRKQGEEVSDAVRTVIARRAPLTEAPSK
jgi:hypothetical protein